MKGMNLGGSGKKRSPRTKKEQATEMSISAAKVRERRIEGGASQVSSAKGGWTFLSISGEEEVGEELSGRVLVSTSATGLGVGRSLAARVFS